MKMQIKETELEKVWELRHEVMYPEKDTEYVKLADDENGIHLGFYINNKLVSVISLFTEEDSIQFRKFATLKDEQGKGYGTILLNEVIDYAERNDIKKIWCNSRIEKTGFYEKFGFIKTDKKYEKDGREFIIVEKISSVL
ncbi:GNAT family N-acetyltransferase [Sebaldella sp. S0638]|uniref:GNAT family N-acetyltransferase n=1 Tax=Sebaldella sp. S0638 TaxID=2957809 RepID=UPI0020A06A6B|nr:GNAT family N-acetyltransferase [Sebaldella sp. S0638]MCP1224613.1 GNAT family N-acetyltransferase [Sebaldella sp. S0638]